MGQLYSRESRIPSPDLVQKPMKKIECRMSVDKTDRKTKKKAHFTSHRSLATVKKQNYFLVASSHQHTSQVEDASELLHVSGITECHDPIEAEYDKSSRLLKIPHRHISNI